MKPILVTGATGTVGKELVGYLIQAGHSVAAASTRPDAAANANQATKLLSSRRLEFGKPDTYAAAFEGVQKMFLLRPPQTTNIARDMIPALEVAQQQGVRHIVFMSVQGVEKNPVVPHRKVEDYLRASAFEYTFLRPSFFMQNLSGIHAADIKERGEIYVPAGRGRTSFIDARDIAQIAVKMLSEPGHSGKAYELTGSAALSYSEVAKIFSDVLQKDIYYPNPNALAFYSHMRSRGLERSYILVMVALYTVCRFGLAAHVTSDTAELLGREPIGMAQFVEDYRESFLGG